ncbi:MAG TPA: alpha/beta hydrolase [Dehalococcoidia bacterium]|nr:alpha/beta hydrolase [Dehalococcoidia bacterium]
MTITKNARETTITVGGAKVQMFTGGSGPALLFLHGAGGNAGWQAYHEELSRSYTVYVPSQPGFNSTERPDWVYTIADVAHFNQQMVQQLGLNQYVLMGSSMGGWLAAEMAAMCHHNLKALVLVDAAGIKPQNSDIAEIFMVSAQTRLKQRFFDPTQVPDYQKYTRQLTPEEQQVEHGNREMASRLCWKPYLYNPSLPHYLRGVPTPTLIVWGRQDAIIPVECGEQFRQALPNATLRVIDRCGHSPALEKPQEFLHAVNEFLARLK